MKKTNVLSLFDGISCGQVALERAGIQVDKYYASEIDKYAIQVTQKNYHNTIQLGNINDWEKWNIDWSSIDLVMGGSPCQGFSNAGKGLNFDDPRSKLFFVFVDILNHIKKLNPNVKFLLENVKMKKEWQNLISEFMGVEPITISSALVSAQNRERLYWTNIPNVEQPHDKNIKLDDVIMSKHQVIKLVPFVEKKISLIKDKYGYIPKRFNPYNLSEITDKSPCLTAQGNSQTKSSSVILHNGECFMMLESGDWERIQTLPIGYTECLLDEGKRKTVIGNGWTVDVIVHILKGLKERIENDN